MSSRSATGTISTTSSHGTASSKKYANAAAYNGAQVNNDTGANNNLIANGNNHNHSTAKRRNSDNPHHNHYLDSDIVMQTSCSPTPATGPINVTNVLPHYHDVWADRPIVTQKIRLVEFSAFIEYQQVVTPATTTKGLEASMALAAAAAAATATSGHESKSTTLPSMQHQHQQQHHHNQSAMTSLSAVNSQRQAYNQQAYGHLNGTTLPNPQHQMPHQPQVQHPSLWNHSHNPHNAQNGIDNRQHHLQHLLRQQPHLFGQSVNQIDANNAIGNLKRHSYVKIDYKLPINRQLNKLEHIDISQIQDKFPEIGGPNGLFQRTPQDSFFLIKFWADINVDINNDIINSDDQQNSYYGFSSHFETIQPYRNLSCSTKACSYGLQIVEKVDKVYATYNSSSGRYSYLIDRSPMCEFMIQFIRKLKHLPRIAQMNSVLENFTVLQVITSDSTGEILLSLAYVFEITQPSTASSTTNTDSTDAIQNGPHYHVYKLTKD